MFQPENAICGESGGGGNRTRVGNPRLMNQKGIRI
jgi:hypothetical protein